MDNNKVKLVSENNILVCKKRTNDIEKNNHSDIYKKLNNITIIINSDKYTLKVPRIICWDAENKILTMDYCKGKNLQHILCSTDMDYRNKGVAITNAILQILLENRVGWSDFAPRNIIIDCNEISLIDFENYTIEAISNQKAFLQNRVYSEYASFLLEEERLFNLDEIFDENMFFQKTGKRTIAVANKLGLKTNPVSSTDDIKIQKLFIQAETPYKDNSGAIIFPRLDLDLFTGSGPIPNINKYIEETLKRKMLYDLRSNMLQQNTDKIDMNNNEV